MKRITALLLALAMCAVLCACGGSEYDKYEDIFEYLEEGDYDSAIEEIEAMREDEEEDEDEDKDNKGKDKEKDASEEDTSIEDNGTDSTNTDDTAMEIALPEFTAEEQDIYWEYSDIVYELEAYDPTCPDSFSLWDDEAERSLYRSEALEYCYNKLLTLEAVDKWLGTEYDHAALPPRQQLLDGFKTVDNVLLYSTITTVDNMGNENSRTADEWFYDENGRLAYWDANSGRPYENEYGISGWYIYEYDETGKPCVITVRSYSGDDDIDGLINPMYDENGVLTADIVKTNNGEFEHKYTYDDQGRVVEMRYGTEGSDGYVYVYTYDENGRLATRLCIECVEYGTPDEHAWNSWETTYTYDENGVLTEMSFTDSHFWTKDKLSWSTTDTIQCFCDDEGRIVKLVITPGNRIDDEGEVMSTPDYASKTVEYVYGTYYIYTPAE